MLTYTQRAELCQHPLTKKLFSLMDSKQTNLGLAADVTTKAELLTLAESVGPEICVLKTHIDILEDFDLELITSLQQLAQQHQFVVFEDRKFADIGNTVRLQYEQGVYHIAEWADIVTVHAVPGPGVVEGLKAGGLSRGNGALMLAEMSSAGNLATGDYTEAAIAMTKQHADFVIGLIAQHKLIDDPVFITMTPGVKLQAGTDQLQQQYNTPQHAIADNGADVILVGRGICHADDPLATAKQYRQAGWQAYQATLD